MSSQHAVARIPVTAIDLGRVAAGTVLETRFKVVNDGGRRLILRQQTSSCPCVTGRSQPLILFPDETKYITLCLDSRNLEGPFQLEMNYSTNDPGMPKFALRLRVDVVLQLQDAAT